MTLKTVKAQKAVDQSKYDVVPLSKGHHLIAPKPRVVLGQNYNVWLRQQFHNANRSAQLRSERARLESFRTGLDDGILKRAFGEEIQELDKTIARLARQGIPATLHPNELVFS